MKQFFASLFAWLLNSPSALAFDPQARGEIDELLSFLETSAVRFVRHRTEYAAAEAAHLLRVKLANAGARVKTADDFIVEVATGTYFCRKPYFVKFADGRKEPSGEWLKAHLGEMRGKKR